MHLQKLTKSNQLYFNFSRKVKKGNIRITGTNNSLKWLFIQGNSEFEPVNFLFTCSRNSSALNSAALQNLKRFWNMGKLKNSKMGSNCF